MNAKGSDAQRIPYNVKGDMGVCLGVIRMKFLAMICGRGGPVRSFGYAVILGSFRFLFLLFSFSIFLSSCLRPPTEGLRAVLRQAGTNQVELQKALTYYTAAAQDSLKLKACQYLIENMSGQYGYEGEGVERFRAEVDSLNPGNPFLCQALQSVYYNLLPKPRGLRKRLDVDAVSSEFLIQHIERCFDLRARVPWLRFLSFNDFCDYLLPYRVDHESLAQVPSLLDTTAFAQFEKLALDVLEDDIYLYPKTVANMLVPMYGTYSVALPAPFSRYTKVECYEEALMQLYRYRSLGISSALDAVPYWGNFNGSHYWATVIDPSSQEIIPWDQQRQKAPKVYRRLFRRDALPRDEVYIPEFFENAYWHDVTDRYLPTADVCVKLPGKYAHRLVYLCVFNDGEWRPVAWSKAKGRRVEFKKLGYDVVYLPVCYEQHKQQVVGDPFIPRTEGRVSRPVCGKDRMDFTAYRKYPYNFRGMGGTSMVGTRFSYACRKDFADEVEFYRVKHNTHMQVCDILLPEDSLQYLRIRPYRTMSLAELSFHGEDKHLQDFTVDSGQAAELCFDKDPLTYQDFTGDVVIDFGRKVRLDTLRYLPMNDGNGIYPHNVYELRYWEHNRWTPFAQVHANAYAIPFHDVPAGGLYWLRNLTTGREERIFTVENGKMRFY